MNFQPDQIFKQLVTEFLDEPFAKRQRFHEKDLATVCYEVESAFNSLDSNTTSYEKSRDLLCLILCHLELLGYSEMPAMILGDLNPSSSKPVASSPFLVAAKFLKHLKDSKPDFPDQQHLNQLIGFHLCMELETHANNLLKPPFFLSLRELGLLVRERSLNEALADLLLSLDSKKTDSTNWEIEQSESWLSELERDFEAAVEYLNESFSLNSERDKAA